MRRDISTIVVVVLVALGLFLGYLIFQQLYPSAQQETLSPKETGENVPDTSSAKASVLQWPSQDAADEEKQRHAELIRSLAKESDVLLITKGCAVSPTVLAIGAGETVVAQNQDSLPHTLQHQTAGLSVTIPAGQEQAITADFVRGLGDYGYSCDNKAGIVGIFHVISQ